MTIYTTGTWKPAPGKEEAFVEAWAEFASWASGMDGVGALRLAQDVRDTERFVSFGTWESIEAVRAWKGAADFRERLARVVQHVTEFEPTELALVASAESGTARKTEDVARVS
ncbi:MAG: antibiotic biosynthesis monooxygenase [Actinobacteria bacterium]|nr:MAG: antibiotic biosynthesis monooxygenase [Actinomycetota bacterium]